MAAFGAQYLCFAPFNGAETNLAMPTYGSGLELGPLVKADLTITLASGEIYGDDIKQEQVDEFAGGSIAIETTDLSDEGKMTLYGLNETEDGEIGYNANDQAPYGGLGYYKVLQRSGRRYYRAIFYPKTQAALTGDNAATRGSSITFQTDTATINVLAPLMPSGCWKYEKTFDTIEEARAYIQQKLNITQDTKPDNPPEPEEPITPPETDNEEGEETV